MEFVKDGSNNRSIVDRHPVVPFLVLRFGAVSNLFLAVRKFGLDVAHFIAILDLDECLALGLVQIQDGFHQFMAVPSAVVKKGVLLQLRLRFSRM